MPEYSLDCVFLRERCRDGLKALTGIRFGRSRNRNDRRMKITPGNHARQAEINGLARMVIGEES
jgi:hypothetical protein